MSVKGASTVITIVELVLFLVVKSSTPQLCSEITQLACLLSVGIVMKSYNYGVLFSVFFV